MIVPMKKATVAVLHSMSAQALEDLRAMGALHLKPVRPPQSEEADVVRGRIDVIERAIQLLQSRKKTEAEGPEKTGASPAAADEILAKEAARQEHEDRLEGLSREIERLRPMGDFSPHDFAWLRSEGVTAKIYRCTLKELQEAKISVPFSPVSSEGATRYLLAVNDGEIALPFEEVRLPEKGLGALKKEAEDLTRRLAEFERELDLSAADLASLEREERLQRERLEFAEAAAGMGQEGEIAYIQGYVPIDEAGNLEGRAKEAGWGLMVEEVSEADQPPTLLRNPRWIRIIQPVFDFMGTVPGYDEFDVSFWFLVSLSLFFAMLVGDGGYGLFFLLATFFLRRRHKSAPSEPFVLFYVFSLATIAWGLVTGTWFGIEALSKLSILSWAIVPELYSFTQNQDFMIRFCFALGAFHLTMAHLMRARRKIGSIRFLNDVGWICILWALYLLAGYLVLGGRRSPLIPYLLIAGVLLAALFAPPRGKFFKSALLGLADLPLTVIASFSDLVSYIRLYAVGYATLVVAASFNGMASEFGWSLSRGVFAVSVALLGHAMNILLAIMAVIVHGIRLNMLEFSSHLGMGWTGHEYDPFRKRI